MPADRVLDVAWTVAESLALEMLTFMGDDVREGMQAIREKRSPVSPSAR